MSQKEGVTEVIDGKTYTMYMLPPMVSNDLLIDVAKMIGPALGPVVDYLVTGKKSDELSAVMDKELDSGFFTKVATSLSRELDKEVFTRVIQTFKQFTHVDGQPLDRIFDAHFRGELGAMYRWLAWGMRVQWGKCWSALGGVVSLPGAIVPPVPPSKSPSI